VLVGLLSGATGHLSAWRSTQETSTGKVFLPYMAFASWLMSQQDTPQWLLTLSESGLNMVTRRHLPTASPSQTVR
jgi:hypothetical protein